jgi:metal-responsive CopG/Arc/MetJ family transcriptional regulator
MFKIKQRKEKKTMPKPVCRTIYIDPKVDNELNQYINGTTFRNRSHAVETILKAWLEYRRSQGRGEQVSMFDIAQPRKEKWSKK